MINDILQIISYVVAKGYLEEVGKRKCSVSKRLAYVWSVK